MELEVGAACRAALRSSNQLPHKVERKQHENHYSIRCARLVYLGKRLSLKPKIDRAAKRRLVTFKKSHAFWVIRSQADPCTNAVLLCRR